MARRFATQVFRSAIFRVVLISILAIPAPALADKGYQNARSERPYGVNMGVLGRSIVYGLELNRALGSQWLVAIGIARVAGQNDALTTSGRTGLVPIYISQYFSPFDSSFFWSAGVTWITLPAEVEGTSAILGRLRFSGASFVPNVGIGYEIRQDDGFLFRIDGLAMKGDGIFLATGFSLGYCF